MAEGRREDTVEAKPAAPEADAAPFPDGPPPLPPVERPARRRWRGAFLAGLVVGLAVAGGGAYVGSQAWLASTYLPRVAAVEKRTQALEAALAAQPAPATATVDPAAIDALATRLDALNDAVEAMRDAPPPAPVADAALEARVAALEARLAEAAADPVSAVPSATLPAPDVRALEQRLAALESRLVTGASAEDVARFQARTEEAASTAAAAADAGKALALRVEALEGVVGERGTAALIIVLAQLRQGLVADAPYAPTLAVARRLAQGDPAIDALLADLEGHAATGAPSRDALAAGFPAVVDAVLEARPSSDAPWYERALARLQGIVTVRRVGADVPGDEPEARVARAEAALAAGDLAAAATEMEPLFSQPAVGDWLAGARARLARDAAAQRLAETVVSLAAGTD